MCLCVICDYLTIELCSTMMMFLCLQDGRSSLLFASQFGHHEVVKMLLSADANVDLQDKVSTTSPSQRPCPELESYVHTFVVENMGGGYSCVHLY